MVEGASHEGFFWDTYLWVMSKNSGGDDERAFEKSIRENPNQMKQPEMGDSSGVAHEVAAATATDGGGGGSKKIDEDFGEIKGGIKSENDDTMVSGKKEKVKRELATNDHELHILIERERRKKMRNMFHQLHDLMPHLPHKVDKASLVDKAVNYIKTLQHTLYELERKKLERLYGQSPNTTREWILAEHGSSTGLIGKVSSSSTPSSSFPFFSPKVFQTWVSSNVTLNVCGVDAHFSICSPRKPGIFTTICFVLERHELEVVSAQIDTDESKSLYMIHAKIRACDLFMEMTRYDEIYIQAATEISGCVNSISSYF